MSIVDLDVSFNLAYAVGSTINCYMDLIILTSVKWQVLFVSIPMAYVIIQLQVMDIEFKIFLVSVMNQCSKGQV